MAVGGGEWRKSCFSRWATYFLRYFQVAKPFSINTFRPIPFGKNTDIFAGFISPPTPKKWRWVAVGGGNRVFHAPFNMLKPAVSFAAFLLVFYSLAPPRILRTMYFVGTKYLSSLWTSMPS
jgi:hypothetical protein